MNYIVKISWEEFKSLCIVSKSLVPQYVIVNTRYRLFAIDSRIVYECHLLENAEIAEFESSYISSFNKRIDAVDEDGNITSSSQISLEGIITWIVSDNLCSLTLPSVDPSFNGSPPAVIGTVHKNGDQIVYEWVPSPGKKLYCLESQLIASSDIVMNTTTCHFIGTNTGKFGNRNFDRTYAGEWGRSGYRVQADKAFESAYERRLEWDYVEEGRPPIILKSSYGAKITLTRSNAMTGTEAYVKIKVISLDE